MITPFKKQEEQEANNSYLSVKIIKSGSCNSL